MAQIAYLILCFLAALKLPCLMWSTYRDYQSGLSTSAKNNLVKQHVDITRAVDADARRILKANRWQLSQAIVRLLDPSSCFPACADNRLTITAIHVQDAYYDDDAAMAATAARDKKSAGPDKSAANLGAMFDHYAGARLSMKAMAAKCKNVDKMDFDATQAWCSDLSVELDEPVLFAIAELTKAPTMGYFDRKTWVDGWKSVKKDSIDGQKGYLETLRKNMKSDEAYFTKVYNFCFEYAKESGQKSLSLDIAASLWPLLFSSAPVSMFSESSAYSPSDPDQQTNYLGGFIDFLKTEKGGRSVSKDVWSLFLEFSSTIDAKFENYDLDAAWPSIIDEFVEWAKAKLARGEEITSSAMEE